MKKVWSILLVLALMTAVFTGAMAEGSTYDGEILFNGIPWGATMTEVSDRLAQQDIDFSRWSNRSHQQDEKDDTLYFGARCLCEPLYLNLMSRMPTLLEMTEVVDREAVRHIVYGGTSDGFSAVAGHDVQQTVLMFAYVPEDGALVYDDEHTALYCASYAVNYEWNKSKQTSDDLCEKLTGIYGEPFYEGDDLTFIFGEVRLNAELAAESGLSNFDTYYDLVRIVNEYDADEGQRVTVWKTSEGNVYIILTEGNEIHLTYLNTDGFEWLAEADALAEPFIQEKNEPNNDVSGL